MKPSSREDQNRKTGLIPLPLLWGSYQGFAVFYYQASTRKDCKKTKHRCFITLRNRQKPLCLHIAECFGHWRNKKHSSHAGMTNGCFRAGESVITESSSPTMRQMGKKLTRNMLRDALSLSQNWNCGQEVQEGAIYIYMYICEYIHIICIYHIYIYIYILCVYIYIYFYKQTLLETECPFLTGKKSFFARQNNKQKGFRCLCIYSYIYIYTYIHIKSYEWINQTFPVSSSRSKFVQRFTLNKYIFFLTPKSGWYYCTMVIEMYVIHIILHSIYSIIWIIKRNYVVSVYYVSYIVSTYHNSIVNIYIYMLKITPAIHPTDFSPKLPPRSAPGFASLCRKCWNKCPIPSIHSPVGGFLKWWYPTTMVFPTKNDHFGVFGGYHHLRKHPVGKRSCEDFGKYSCLSSTNHSSFVIFRRFSWNDWNPYATRNWRWKPKKMLILSSLAPQLFLEQLPGIHLSFCRAHLDLLGVSFVSKGTRSFIPSKEFHSFCTLISYAHQLMKWIQIQRGQQTNKKKNQKIGSFATFRVGKP